MKISVLTATYNRCIELDRLYASLVVNSNSNIDFEWLIMDDGSTDKTKLTVENYIKQNIIDIKYYYQKNQGKMSAINNLVYYATGDVMVTCDSDDYFTTRAFDIISEYSDKLLNDETVYALVFLKKDQNGKISGNKFCEDIHRSDMFNLYFREKVVGEKVLVFKTKIRKKYRHELEADEKFVTESRMYHKMDLDYDIIGINKPIEIIEYKEDGYTKNLQTQFVENPLGYYEFFREMLELDLKGVTFNKRLYIYKHYILFANLAERKDAISNVCGFFNKFMITILWIPGIILTRKRFGKKEEKQKENEKNENVTEK